MSTMFAPLEAVMTPEMYAKVGERFGVPGDMVQKGINVALPLLTRGLSMAADTPEGQVAIAEAVKEADAGVLGNLTSFLGSLSGSEAGATMLTRLFGDESRVVTAGIKEATGLDITPVVGMLGPLILGFLNSTAQKEGMDTNALIKKIKSEARSVERRKSDEATLVNDVLGKVTEVRAMKGRFSAQEWAQVRNGPMAATTLVIAASPSSAGKTAQEMAAALDSVRESVKDAAPTSLLAALYHPGVDDLTAEGITDALGAAKQAAALVEKNVPEEAKAYKELLVKAAYAAAESVKEGGFLGIGGKKVTPEEQAAIDALVAALGV
ncbi:MAG: DUF937 domain-containing protein [Oscillochloridaceae bacterium]|nr:DUF937 domain-containing protein [Chloroflexaceae bacterium]MDW8389051.1 DUF937 domain-containing protein [Oscillochloridaceae bacterium]